MASKTRKWTDEHLVNQTTSEDPIKRPNGETQWRDSMKILMFRTRSVIGIGYNSSDNGQYRVIQNSILQRSALVPRGSRVRDER